MMIIRLLFKWATLASMVHCSYARVISWYSATFAMSCPLAFVAGNGSRSTCSSDHPCIVTPPVVSHATATGLRYGHVLTTAKKENYLYVPVLHKSDPKQESHQTHAETAHSSLQYLERTLVSSHFNQGDGRCGSRVLPHRPWPQRKHLHCRICCVELMIQSLSNSNPRRRHRTHLPWLAPT
jgi:hypothetical protein